MPINNPVSYLRNLADVSIVSPTNGDFLYYDDATGLWKPKAHANLTTGVHGVGAGAVVGTALTQTLTNKTLIATTNVVEEYYTFTSTSTPIPSGGSLRNFYSLTALAANATFITPSGTPVNANRLIIRVKDNGIARTLGWDAIYRAMEFALPTTTVSSKTLYLGFIYNSADSKWDMVAINQEA